MSKAPDDHVSLRPLPPPRSKRPRACVICGAAATQHDSRRKINLCDTHADDLRAGRPWSLNRRTR